MFKLFTIKGGKISAFGITKAMIIALVTSGLVVVIASYFKISQEDIWKFIIKIQEHLGIKFGEDLNEQIRKDPKLLDFIAKGKVDAALEEYRRSTGDDGTVRITPPRYIERPIDLEACYSAECRALGGEMRLCAPWIPDCTDTPQSGTEELTVPQKSGIINEWLGNEPQAPGKFKF